MPPTSTRPSVRPKGHLLRILGVGFGIAVIVGGAIGSGILRTPGLVAAQLGSPRLIIAVWLGVGIYAFCCTLSIIELGLCFPARALFALRIREPDLPRPFKAWGYPSTNLGVLLASAAFLIATVVGDLKDALFTLILISLSYPVYLFVAKSKLLRASTSGAIMAPPE